MIPVMLAARKLDGEDPMTIYYLRCVYFSVQALIVLLLAFVYVRATAAANSTNGSKIIYVPPAPQPFADPNAKKKYTETTYAAHIMSQARSLLGSTLFGICLTSGLHFYRGMIIGLAIQSIMGPFNLVENALVKCLVLGSGSVNPEDKVFDEKTSEELTQEDEVVDDGGNPVVRQITANKGAGTDKPLDLGTLLLDTWDAGESADLGPLMEALNKKNCNFKMPDKGWTPLMILAGLGVKGTSSAIRQVKELGGNPAVVDSEGWTAMHWAAFHGRAEAVKALRDDVALISVKDKDGKVPLDHARAENYDDVAKILEELAADGSSAKKSDEGLRKRK